MRKWQKICLAGAVLIGLSSTSGIAKQPEDRGNTPGLGWGGNKGAPGPIAGAGLPVAVLIGGYLLMRRYRQHGNRE